MLFPDHGLVRKKTQGVLRYNIGEDAYLDPDFLRKAMGTTEDRGLAAEGLRLIHSWKVSFGTSNTGKKKLGERERANIVERGENSYENKTKRQKGKMKYTNVYEEQVAAARLERLLPYHNGRTWGYSVSSPGQPYSHPNEGERDVKRPENAIGAEIGALLYGHHGRDCRNPHIRCARLSRGRWRRPSTPFGGITPTSPQHERMPIQWGPCRSRPCEAITHKRRKTTREKDLATARTVCRDGWGDRTGERERVFTPQSGKRPAEERDTSDAMAGASGTRTDTRRSGLGDRDRDGVGARAGAPRSVG